MSHTITPLLHSDIARMEDHLLRLSVEDRSLRFASGVVTDDTIRRYVRSIPFDRDCVLAVQNDRGAVIGVVHGCRFAAYGKPHMEAAFSVDAECRGLGMAKGLMGALLAVAAEEASDSGVIVVASCVARNLPMRSVLDHAGMTMRREDDEIQAQALILPPASAKPAAKHAARVEHATIAMS